MNNENIALMRQQHMVSLGYLTLIEITRDEEQRKEWIKKYADMQVEMSAPHFEQAIAESFHLSERISNARPIANIEVTTDGKIKFTEEF